ncbi:MAG: hypothetical protein JWP59_558 [Massilia sp.]|nr:hypothetical protein [Massilia sp.]
MATSSYTEPYRSSAIPQTGFYCLLYLANALIGMASISVTITYIMQLYNAVMRRNALGLSMNVMTRDTADAAVLLAGLGPQGRFDTGYTVVANLGASLTTIKEAHHLYPLLFFYRPYHPASSIPRIAFIALDAVTLLRTALDDGEYRWLKESAAVESLGGLAAILVKTLQCTFIPGAAQKPTSGRSRRAATMRGARATGPRCASSNRQASACGPTRTTERSSTHGCGRSGIRTSSASHATWTTTLP